MVVLCTKTQCGFSQQCWVVPAGTLSFYCSPRPVLGSGRDAEVWLQSNGLFLAEKGAERG